MNCKACGEPIPSSLLQKDSFRCPSCGRTYYRGSKTASAPSRAKRGSVSRPKGGAKPPRWLLPTVAALVILALVAGGAWMLRGRGLGASGVSGTVVIDNIATKKNQIFTIEIPRQRGNYMVLTESSQVGIVCAAKDKTDTSFDLVVRNVYTKDRAPTITWMLVPCKAS